MKFPPATLRSISHRDHIGAWLVAAGLTGAIAEIGVFHGAYTEVLLRTFPGNVFAVDPWVNQPESVYFDGANKVDMEAVWREVQAGIGQHPRCLLIRKMSVDAAHCLVAPPLAGVYLDGNHSLASARDDIEAWFPNVQIGGIFAGHDFYTRYDADTNSDAQQAVAEFAERVNQWPQITWCNSWWFLKTQEMDDAYHGRNREW